MAKQRHRCHTGLAGITPAQRSGELTILSQTLPHAAGENTATASFRLRPPLELYFATDTSRSRRIAQGFIMPVHESTGMVETLNGSSTITRPITTDTAATPGWQELHWLNAVAYSRSQSPTLNHIPGGNIATAYFRPQLPPELEFDTDRLAFPTVDGKSMPRAKMLQTQFYPALSRAKLRRVTFHTLRHSCASAIIASGAPITEVQHRLGHANPAITLLVYSHFLKHAESDVADRLADALLNSPLAPRTQKEIEPSASAIAS